MNKNLFSAVAFDLEAIHINASGTVNSLLVVEELLERYDIRTQTVDQDVALQLLLDRVPKLCDLLLLIWRDLSRNLDSLELATNLLNDAWKASEPEC